MFVYWLMFLAVSLVAISRMRPLHAGAAPARWNGTWLSFFIFLVLAIGLRHRVGGDWEAYLIHIDLAAGTPFEDALEGRDPAYAFLNWLGANYLGGPYFPNTVCALLFTWGLLTFCRHQPRPWLALGVAVPYLVIVVAMGYSRQGVAIGLSMLGLVALMQGRLLHFVLWVTAGALFHKSAIVLVPLAVFVGSRYRLLTFLGIAASAVVLFVLLLQEAVDSLVYGYLDADMESSGAAIRVAMNAVPAAIFLLYGRRFAMPAAQRKFWTYVSVAALLFLPLLKLSPSSTAVDRVALYWIPLQLFVWSRVPDAFGRPGRRNATWVYGVLAYSAAVQFVWLVFASHAFAWLPYRFLPWEALFGTVD